MGYQTVKSVPMTQTYEGALRVFESIKPIRGREPERRPLGQRRDADTYWVRKNDNNDIEYMLYRTPVLTFKPDDTVEVCMGGWNSVSTRQFITQVTGLRVGTQRSVALIGVGGEKYAFAGNDRLRLKWVASGTGINAGNWSMLSFPRQTGLRVNRQAANNVRARYKAFGDYLSGFLKVRKDEHDDVRITAHELGQAIGFTQSVEPTYAIVNRLGNSGRTYRSGASVYQFIALTEWRLIHSEPYSGQEKQNRNAVLEKARKLMQSENHEDYYKMAMILCSCNSYNVLAYDETGENWITETTSFVSVAYKNLVTKMHADEVLERIELPTGSIPNQTYESWLTLLGKGEEA